MEVLQCHHSNSYSSIGLSFTRQKNKIPRKKKWKLPSVVQSPVGSSAHVRRTLLGLSIEKSFLERCNLGKSLCALVPQCNSATKTLLELWSRETESSSVVCSVTSGIRNTCSVDGGAASRGANCGGRRRRLTTRTSCDDVETSFAPLAYSSVFERAAGSSTLCV